MSFTITDVRADIDALLASAVDNATWTAAIKDEGARQALRAYNLQGPAYEADVVVTVTGHEQDLSVINDLVAIECVAYPWHDGLLIEDYAVRWRRIGAFSVRVDGIAPALGETMRVRYRSAHTISGLEGALTTTVVDAHRGLLAQGALAYALALRLRQISENPAIPHEAAALLQSLRRGWDDVFAQGLDMLSGATQNPVWARVGL